ncbi:MAG: trypsin-like peptidase domain-containing protein [Pseudomonadota bacterium]|nr:trypsin-like peptidase domain-containing protein [Pseudomonadota bacterium]
MFRSLILRLSGFCVLAALAGATWWAGAAFSAQPTAAAAPRTPTPRGPLGAEERETIALFERSRQAVVYIAPTQRVFDLSLNALQVPSGTGSGFIWDEQGHVVTNNHVIEGASGAQVRLADGRSFSAELVGRSPYHDLAVLRIDTGARHPPALPIGTSEDLKVGQKVFAIGNPFGLDWTLTTGIVSALNRELPTQEGMAIRDLIQTDAAINPGNSGGPLLDSAGRLIGVNTAIFSPSGAYAGVGFAVPVDTVNRVVPRLIATGRYTRPSLGVEVRSEINAWLVDQNKVKGVYVLGVTRGSPAAAAGLRAARIDARGNVAVGDVILSVGNRRTEKVEDLYDALDRANAGERILLTVQRAREQVRVPVQLVEGR